MDVIINWLIGLEHLAGEIYTKASLYFSSDKNLKDFLENMAEDEAWHYHIMASASEHYRKNPIYELDVTVDTEISERITGIFNTLCKELEENSLTKTRLYDSIIIAEFSEWNDIFLYVVNTLKNNIKEFTYISPRIQNHKRRIELFYENQQESADILTSFKRLKPVWKDKILIVDDEEPIVELLEAILENEGIIDKAYNGIDALAKVKDNYYKLIISDIDMPGMDGFSLFEKLSEIDPNMNEKFLFFTGQLSGERLSYFNEKKVGYMKKPERMNLIKEKAIHILMKNNFDRKK